MMAIGVGNRHRKSVVETMHKPRRVHHGVRIRKIGAAERIRYCRLVVGEASAQIGVVAEMIDTSERETDTIVPVEQKALDRLNGIAEIERDLLEPTPARPIDIDKQGQSIIDLLRKA